jgi:glycosyltransferase EpsE
MTKVSVIMAAYNCESTVRGAVNSIYNQTFGDWEFIICDDGSIDNTRTILEERASADRRLVLVKQEKNKGPAAARNSCINLARGEYLAIQDADDVSLPSRLEEQVVFLDGHRDVSCVGTYAELFGDDGKTWGLLKAPKLPERTDWVKGSSAIHASVMVRTEDVRDAGGYDESSRAMRVEDYDLLVRLIEGGHKIVTLPKVLYRIHWDISDYTRKKSRYRLNEVRVRWKALQLSGIPLYYYVYLMKPLVTALIPSKMMYHYQSQRFRKWATE